MAELRSLELAPRRAVIALLRDLLERAEAGEVLARRCAGACIVPSATTTAFVFGDGDIAHLVCSIERVKCAC